MPNAGTNTNLLGYQTGSPKNIQQREVLSHGHMPEENYFVGDDGELITVEDVQTQLQTKR